MLLTVLALSLVALALAVPTIASRIATARERRAKNAKRPERPMLADPGRDRRAEQRARELLRSCVNDEEWSMYRDLGFIRVWGGESGAAGDDVLARDLRGVPYAYLVYPHKPIVAYLPQTGQLLNEYCVEFPDETRPYGSSRLPDSDDVLAKWMALTADEERLIDSANMHLAGRQVDPARVHRDLWRLQEWERRRMRRLARRSSDSADRGAGPAGSVSAP